MAQNEKLNSSGKKKLANHGTFALIVKFEGTFVFALQTGNPSQPDLITSVDVYTPACGHMYSAGIEGEWNDPFCKPDPQNKDHGLLMLEPRRHCLEVATSTPSNLSLRQLRTNIRKANLWPTVGRPVMQGWDLVMRIPPPSDSQSWATESIPVKKSFKGSDSATFTHIGLTQSLTYQNVSSFRLKGSPLPLYPPVGKSGTVTFIVNAEPACIPSLDHQRCAAKALAQVVGLDLTLEKPLHAMISSGLMNAKTGSCMGSAIVEPG